MDIPGARAKTQSADDLSVFLNMGYTWLYLQDGCIIPLDFLKFWGVLQPFTPQAVAPFVSLVVSPILDTNAKPTALELRPATPSRRVASTLLS